MEKLQSLNYGQHLLFSYLCISIEGRKGSPLDTEDLEEIINQVIELTNPKYFDDNLSECPDVKIMVQPEKSFDIFCDFWDENEIYFSELF